MTSIASAPMAVGEPTEFVAGKAAGDFGKGRQDAPAPRVTGDLPALWEHCGGLYGAEVNYETAAGG